MSGCALFPDPAIFRIADLDIVGRRLPDGTPVIPADQVMALVNLVSRRDAVLQLDLTELQRLEDWIRSALFASKA